MGFIFPIFIRLTGPGFPAAPQMDAVYKLLYENPEAHTKVSEDDIAKMNLMSLTMSETAERDMDFRLTGEESELLGRVADAIRFPEADSDNYMRPSPQIFYLKAP